MKRWTRKLLAGLLSFGMLLQVASPLSALAADGGSAAPGLTVTVNDKAYTLAVDSSGQVIVPNEWTTAGLPEVSYAAGTYTFTGRLGNLWAGSETHDNISIIGSDTAKPNVVLNEGSRYQTVMGLLTVENVNNFTSTDEIYGAAILNCDGDVNLADGVAVGSLTVQSANNVTVAANNGSYTVSGGIDITCSGNVEITNSGNGTLTDSFIFLNDITGSIKLSGGGDDVAYASATAGMLYLKNCTGTLDITSNGTGRAVLELSCTDNTLLKSVTINSKGTAAAVGYEIYYPIDIVSSGEVKITNTNGPVAGGNLTVKADTVTLNGNSANSLITDAFSADISAASLTAANSGTGAVGQVKFTKTGTDDYYIATGDSASSATQTKMEGEVYNPGTVSAKYLRISTDEFVPAPATPYGFSVNGTSVTAENAETTLPDGMTYDKAANKLTATKDIIGDLTIAADNTNTTLDVELKSVDGALAVGKYREPGARDVTINGTVTGKTDVNCTGDITVNGTIASEQNGADDLNRLDTTTGNITVTSDGAVWGQYASVILKAADGSVTVSGNKPSESLSGPNLTVWATEMEINNPDGKISAIIFVPQCPGDYYINKSAEPAERRPWTLGKEAIFSEAVDSKLVISQTKPSIHQHTLGVWEYDETNHWKTCSVCNEKVDKAVHNFDSDGVCEECGYKDPNYKPEHQHTPGTEWKYDDTNHWHTCTTCEENVQLDKAEHKFDENGVCECGYKDPNYKPEHQHTASTEWQHDDTNHWHTCTTCEENVQLDKAPHNFGEDGKAEKCEECGFANPDYVAPAPDDTGDTGTVDSGSDAGGAVAAVVVGGAAVWGGYEIATRVILHNILPEGTAIPANRGQLALLVWNNAGRPAPVNEAAFVDMDDADMAKAAQWCVEQGIMEAKTAETFKPEGWTPKLKVIETWNKAFPKQ